ncbi:hypothetical protein [Parapedobacter tibetensis]|uniref:hypothetical protein n=1 Tax=Parapedobacter tibetensis TaxID=2972951 RepID=UPI00214DEFC7|nr:hypothetical protein [Parapedobacter tibetensis]
MKAILLKLIILSLLFGLLACDKAERLEEDVFRVTFLGEGNGCPSGPLVRFGKNDIDRLERFVHVEFSEGFGDQRVISAVNLKGAYREGQTVTLKIRKFTDEEVPFCLAHVPWYVGVYVLEEYAD